MAPLRLKRRYRSLRQVAPRHLGHLRQSLRQMHHTRRREGVAPLRLKRRYPSLRQVAPRHLGHLRQSLRQMHQYDKARGSGATSSQMPLPVSKTSGTTSSRTPTTVSKTNASVREGEREWHHFVSNAVTRL